MTRHIRPDAHLRGLLGPAWEALQAHHPDLPDCVFERQPEGVPERLGTAGGVVGMTAPPGYPRADDTTYSALTLVVYPGWLLRSGWGSFRALMHEAVHVLDYARHGEVSGHGEIFAKLAREMGMTTTRSERIGEVDYVVGLTAGLKTRYAATMEALDIAWKELGAVNWVIN